jgi:hypothetical protein
MSEKPSDFLNQPVKLWHLLLATGVNLWAIFGGRGELIVVLAIAALLFVGQNNKLWGQK